MRCEHLHDSAAYVLDALSPVERTAYEQHMVGCADCRAEVADLAMLPSLLSRLDPATAATIALGDEQAVRSTVDGLQWSDPSTNAYLPTNPVAHPSGWAGPTVAPPTGQVPGYPPSGQPTNGFEHSAHVVTPARDPLEPRILDRTLARVRAERATARRRRRWQTAGAAFVAACLGVLGVLGFRAAGIGEPIPATPDLVAMRQVANYTPVKARVALESVANGTKVRMSCEYTSSPNGSPKWTLRLVVIPKTGEPQELNSWTAGHGDRYELVGHTSVPRAEILRVELRKGDGSQLLVYDA